MAWHGTSSWHASVSPRQRKQRRRNGNEGSRRRTGLRKRPPTRPRTPRHGVFSSCPPLASTPSYANIVVALGFACITSLMCIRDDKSQFFHAAQARRSFGRFNPAVEVRGGVAPRGCQPTPPSLSPVPTCGCCMDARTLLTALPGQRKPKKRAWTRRTCWLGMDARALVCVAEVVSNRRRTRVVCRYEQFVGLRGNKRQRTSKKAFKRRGGGKGGAASAPST